MGPVLEETGGVGMLRAADNELLSRTNRDRPRGQSFGSFWPPVGSSVARNSRVRRQAMASAAPS